MIVLVHLYESASAMNSITPVSIPSGIITFWADAIGTDLKSSYKEVNKGLFTDQISAFNSYWRIVPYVKTYLFVSIN